MYCFWVGGARRYCTPFKKKICLIKQMRFSKLSHIYDTSLKSIHKTHPYTNTKENIYIHKHQTIVFVELVPLILLLLKRAHNAVTCWYHVVDHHQSEENKNKIQLIGKTQVKTAASQLRTQQSKKIHTATSSLRWCWQSCLFQEGKNILREDILEQCAERTRFRVYFGRNVLHEHTRKPCVERTCFVVFLS